MQAGEGAPSHLSPAGTFYFDSLAGITYQNIDGISNWKNIFSENNHPVDIYVTGGTYDFTSGIATFVNNTGGTFTLFGFNVAGGGGTFTGGTVVGGANFLAGLTSTTITSNSVSATTYYNLPTDIRVTGGTYSNGTTTFTNNTGGTFTVSGYKINDVFVTGSTYSNNTFTFTNNTGGTYSVLFNTVTGLTATTLSAFTFTTPSVRANSNGLTASTISATTYYNLPTDIRVTGGTYNNGTTIFTNNTGGTFNVSGFTTPSSLLGTYLPLSGGTVTGGTLFSSGLTATTLDITDYIDFNTGTTNPSAVGGRVFFDNYSKALSYYDIIGNNVPIAMGQQLYTRVYNATGSQIDKGKVIAITGTSNGLPSAILAVNTHAVTSARPIGLAAENIANNSEGLVLNNGILSGITLNTFSNGDTLYLSDTVAGGYIATTSSLAFTARTNEIGYVLQTGSTTGKIYVNINNEDSNLSLTDIERNILEGNVISSGTYQYTGMTQGTGQTINVALLRGWIVRNTNGYATFPDVTNVYYTGGTNIPLTYLNSADATFILINSASTLVQQTTFPTPQERRQNIFLGKVVHPNRTTITSLNQTVDFDVSPIANIRDLWTPLKLVNQGVLASANGANLSINISSGTLWGNGIGWTTNQLNPNSVSISGSSPTTFQYRTRFGPITGGTAPYTGNTTLVDPANYDLGGVVTAIGGGSNSSTNQRIYLFPTGLVRLQYGQQVYNTLAEAVAGSQTESFVEYSNNRDNGILIGILSVNKNATQLNTTTQALFNFVSKFGEIMGGTGGLSTTTLQQAYDNSTSPEILINATLDGLTIKNGTGNADATTHLIQGENTAGGVTSFITADGGFSGSSVSATTYYGLPTDIRTTGATYSNNTFTFTNNTGGTYNVLFNTVTGLTATTLSATTYQNLPTDIRTTGATYSNNTFTFTNNTGGTYNVLFNTLTGLTVNGNLSVTGDTTSNRFSGSSNTITGTKGTVITSGSSTLAFINILGSNTVGGTGYTDFIRVTNNSAGATNATKTIRVNNTGGIEFLNSAYTAQTLTLGDNGILSIGGGNVATTSNNDATTNYLNFGNNNSQIYDDGNMHIHSRGAGQVMWINTNGGQLNLLTQSPTSSGGIGSGIAIATGTLNGYVSINTGKTVTTSANYGYLTTSGAGTYPGGSQSISISLYATQRIWGQEIDAFSDERMKDIQGEIKLDEAIKLVSDLKPIKYTWKEGDDKGLKAGYSAQQVVKSGFDHLIGLIPTEGLEETIDEDGFVSPKDTQFAMNYDQVTPYHGVVIKHLLEKIQDLEKQIQELKNK